jgi:hypothetical protein
MLGLPAQQKTTIAGGYKGIEKVGVAVVVVLSLPEHIASRVCFQ